jgi:SmpA / OmlA family
MKIARYLPIAAVVLTAACASYSGSGLVPGTSTAAQVEATMGAPRERIKLPGGDTLWAYPRGPHARQTYGVRVGADGVVREVSQLLTVPNLAKLRIGQSTSDEVRALLGPPVSVSALSRLEREVWEYDMYEDQRPINVHIQFDQGKRVREILSVDARPSSVGG